MIPTIGLIDYTRVVCLREACTRVNLARLECIKGKLSRASPDEINRLAGELCKEERRLFRLQNAIVSINFEADKQRASELSLTSGELGQRASSTLARAVESSKAA